MYILGVTTLVNFSFVEFVSVLLLSVVTSSVSSSIYYYYYIIIRSYE